MLAMGTAPIPTSMPHVASSPSTRSLPNHWISPLSLPSSSMRQGLVPHAHEMMQFSQSGQMPFGMVQAPFRLSVVGPGFDLSGMTQVPTAAAAAAAAAAAHGQANMFPLLSLPTITSLLAASMPPPASPGAHSSAFSVNHPHNHNHFGGAVSVPSMGFIASPLQHMLQPAGLQTAAAHWEAPAPVLGHSSASQQSKRSGDAAVPSGGGGNRGQPRKRTDKAKGDTHDGNEQLTILPRRRAGQPEDMKRDPIVLTKKDLQELYNMRLSEAAAKLVCPSPFASPILWGRTYRRHTRAHTRAHTQARAHTNRQTHTHTLSGQH
jgi:hypothetical protein